MGGVAKALFGGGDDGAAKRQAEKQAELQRIANDRQLAEMNRQSEKTATSRAAPRGRRLFETDAGAGATRPSKLAG